jgi:hypothetical protein
MELAPTMAVWYRFPGLDGTNLEDAVGVEGKVVVVTAPRAGSGEKMLMPAGALVVAADLNACDGRAERRADRGHARVLHRQFDSSPFRHRRKWSGRSRNCWRPKRAIGWSPRDPRA